MGKNKKLIIIIIYILFISCNSKTDTLKVSSLPLIDYSFQNFKDTVIIEKYDNKQTKYEISFSNNMPDKVWKFYYPNGAFEAKYYLKEGELISFDYWDKDGSHVIINGNGEAKAYYDNGQIKYNIKYTNNKKNGLFQSWHRNGNIRQKIMYNNGIIIGDIISLDSNGVQLEIIGS